MKSARLSLIPAWISGQWYRYEWFKLTYQGMLRSDLLAEEGGFLEGDGRDCRIVGQVVSFTHGLILNE